MKKILIVLALVALATPGFAADINSDDGTSLGGGNFKPSKSVIVSYEASATAYAAGAKHLQGTKGYAATNIDPKITEISCAAGQSKVTVADADTLPTACED